MNRRLLLISALVLVWTLGSIVQVAAYQEDLGGLTVRLGWGEPAEGTRMWDAWQDIESVYNVNLEWVSRDLDDVMAGILAGDPHHHFGLGRGVPFERGMYAGMWLRLDDYLTPEFLDSRHPYMIRTDWAERQLGELYGLAIPPENLGHSGIFMWNKDLFEREGLPDLHQLYAEGQWTYDVLMQMVRDTALDTTGDGEIDRLALALNLEDYIMEANNAPHWKEVDGRIVSNLGSEEWVTAATFLRDIIDSPGVRTHKAARARLRRDDALDAFAAGNLAMMITSPYHGPPGANARGMEDDFGLLPFPTGPHAEEQYNSLAVTTRLRVVFPNMDLPHMDALIDMADRLHRLTSKYTDFEEMDRDQFDAVARELRDLESLAVWETLFDNAYPVAFAGMPRPGMDGSGNYTQLHPIASVAAEAEAMRPEVQAWLDELTGWNP